ncbi:S-DNA-T family DNA segregation ATPase FtsK/SpoIIIE [Streptomyces avidinii]|nr:S-DNA-T family DNA segregation ATPase FtsK/SpoIIIE [Streptomyces avidinii]SNX80036.1 DNA segregation ATPase FtsK/SpoIIIE, S-DNA-T family [Streptomyces microflavus]
MSHPTAWQTHRQYAATAARWTADRWSKETDRRRTLRAARKPLVRDARAALAQAQAIDPQKVTSIVHRAERELATAKRKVPDPMWLFASKTALATAAAGYVGLPLVPGRVWMWAAVAVSVAVAGAIAWALLHRPAASAIEPTAEERALLKRLQPEHWREHAEQRGLTGTLTGRPKLTESGIVVAVRLDGTWTATKLRGGEDHIRALLGARTGLRMQIKAGKQGGWAELTLRTRSAADGDDLLWSPERRSLGIDTVTGEHVTVPLGERLLIAGRSGAGKSVASRPLLYDASEGDTNALVIIDLKRVEGRLWDHRARVASTPEEVIAVVGELDAEMHDRLDVLPKGQDTWTPSSDRPRITVVVDEGAEVLTAAGRALPGLESIARMGRAACIDLWWMTQKPTINDGIPKQIAPQISTSICLAVRTPAEARVVLGEDAQAKGWNADELPAPGVALIRDGKRKPDPVKVRYMDKAVVIALPDQPIWSRTTTPATAGAPTLTLVKATAEPAAAAAPAAGSVDDRVLSALRSGPLRQADIVTAAELPKGTVSKAVKRLAEAGLLQRLDGGALALPGTDTGTAVAS